MDNGRLRFDEIIVTIAIGWHFFRHIVYYMLMNTAAQFGLEFYLILG